MKRNEVKKSRDTCLLPKWSTMAERVNGYWLQDSWLVAGCWKLAVGLLMACDCDRERALVAGGSLAGDYLLDS